MTVAVDRRAAWRLSPEVSLREEPFGALAYHHGNRRLVVVKSTALARLLERLGEYPSMDDALAEVPESARERVARALENLVDSGIVSGR